MHKSIVLYHTPGEHSKNNRYCSLPYSRSIFSPDRSTLARSCKPIRSFKAETSFSAIGHLLQNPTCAREYNDNKFSILARGRTSFHLFTLEATYIKTSKSKLCKQKEFVYGLKIIH